MTLEPCSACQITYKNEKQKCVVMHRKWNIPKTSHFGLWSALKMPFSKVSTYNLVHICIETSPLTYSTVFKFLKIFKNVKKIGDQIYITKNFQNFENPR